MEYNTTKINHFFKVKKKKPKKKRYIEEHKLFITKKEPKKELKKTKVNKNINGRKKNDGKDKGAKKSNGKLSKNIRVKIENVVKSEQSGRPNFLKNYISRRNI